MAEVVKKKQDLKINELRHPRYIVNELSWLKWRLTFIGGTEFLQRYLVKFSKREDDIDFAERKKLSYVTAFAKKALNKVKNGVFKRMGDIVRAGGPKSYQDACKVDDPLGVDLQGSTMTTFLGREILPELLSMARVGVYVDMPPLPGPTIAERGNRRPYLYYYRAEDIRSWSVNVYGDPTDFQAILLRDSSYDINKKWLLPYETTIRYRYIYIGDDGYVYVQYYNQGFDQQGHEIWTDDEPIRLDIKRIPFVIFEISDSLLADAADYQISLMNLASSGTTYAIKSNYPFYTEQVDWRVESPHLRGPNLTTTSATLAGHDGTTIYVNQDTVREVKVGITGGRQYPSGLERPGFIHPSPEPLRVGMEREEQMKKEIEELVTHSLSSLQPMRKDQSVDDEEGTDAGLHYIGLELEHGERKIAAFWAMYENEETATIHYPTNFTLRNEEDRRVHAEFLKELLPHVPSITYQRELAKQIAKHTLENKVGNMVLDKINTEIDSAPVVYGDPKVIASDIDHGLVCLETASKARGYPAGEVEKASADHAERLARIAAAQTEGQGYGVMAETGQARGVADKGANPKAGKDEKTASQKDKTTDSTAKDKVRGPNA